MSNASAFQSYTSLLFESQTSVRTGLEGRGLIFARKLWYYVATVGGQYNGLADQPDETPKAKNHPINNYNNSVTFK